MQQLPTVSRATIGDERRTEGLLDQPVIGRPGMAQSCVMCDYLLGVYLSVKASRPLTIWRSQACHKGRCFQGCQPAICQPWVCLTVRDCSRWYHQNVYGSYIQRHPWASGLPHLLPLPAPCGAPRQQWATCLHKVQGLPRGAVPAGSNILGPKREGRLWPNCTAEMRENQIIRSKKHLHLHLHP